VLLALAASQVCPALLPRDDQYTVFREAIQVRRNRTAAHDFVSGHPLAFSSLEIMSALIDHIHANMS